MGHIGGCTATLIAADTVLTAAHCFDDDGDGSFDPGRMPQGFFLGPSWDEITAQHEIADIVLHPDRSRQTREKLDVALIFLAEPVPDITPIPVADPGTDAVGEPRSVSAPLENIAVHHRGIEGIETQTGRCRTIRRTVHRHHEHQQKGRNRAAAARRSMKPARDHHHQKRVRRVSRRRWVRSHAMFARGVDKWCWLAASPSPSPYSFTQTLRFRC